MVDVETIASNADVIICGFAFLSENNFIKVINLNNAHGVAVFKLDGTLVETNMDPVEQSVARGYLSNALEYMETAVHA